MPNYAEHANCTRKNSDPRHWDTDCLGKERYRITDQIQLALSRCHRCPCTKQCAKDALKEHSTGVVRAGIPLRPGGLGPDTYPNRVILRRILRGTPPHKAIYRPRKGATQWTPSPSNSPKTEPPQSGKTHKTQG